MAVPTDGATEAQRAKHAAYVEARLPRTTSPQGPGRQMLTDIATRLGPALAWRPASRD